MVVMNIWRCALPDLPLDELEREADEISFLMTGTKLQEKAGGG